MDNKKFLGSARGLVLLVILVLSLVLPQAVMANEHVENGGQVPFYARLGEGEIITDGTWVVVVFYRDPGCIDPLFNMLNFFDWVNAWGCVPTTTGFEIWKNGIGIDMAPLQTVLRGKGNVPVWFVKLDELQATVSDGKLTISELAGLPSLKRGYASHFNETLQPLFGAVKNHLVFNAHGKLENGTAFIVHMVHTESNYNVNIKFSP